jgi:O-antigen/teichoic acid export membrane protein
MFIFTTFMACRYNDSLFYFASRGNTEEERERNVTTALLGTFLVGAGGGLLGAAASPLLSRIVFGVPDYVPYFHLVFLAFGFSMPADMLMCYLQCRKQAGSFVAASCIRLGFGILANITLVVGFGLGLKGVLWGSMLSSAVMMLYTIAILVRRGKWDFDPKIFVSQLRYAGPLGISGLAMLLVHFGDRFFLRKHVGLDELGIYSLAYKIGMLVSYIHMPFQMHWRAYVFEVAKSRDGDRMYARTATYMALVLTFSLVGITAFIHPILRVMAGPEFRSAYQYVPWIALAYVVRALGDYVRSLFLVAGKTGKEVQVTWIASLTCVAGYAVLIPPFKLWGAIASTTLSFVVMLVVAYVRAQHARPFTLERARLFKILVAASPVFALFLLVRPASTLWQAVEGVVMVALFVLVLGLTRCFTPEEIRAILALPREAAAKMQAAAR